MLGSIHDAEDALQEALLRAWRGLKRFEGRSSLRSWLYTIATNTCLNAIAAAEAAVLPTEYPAADPGEGPGEPLIESVWVEPFADEAVGVEDGFAAPEARYERREGVELAFIAALQYLPATQRAVLIMREVLGFSANEAAEALETTARRSTAPCSAPAARSRRAARASQQETLRALGDERITELVESYVEAWEHADVEKVVSMLSEEAACTMPPLQSWFGARRSPGLPRVLAARGRWRWRALPAAPTASRPSASTAGGGALGGYQRSRSTCSPSPDDQITRSTLSSSDHRGSARGRSSPARPGIRPARGQAAFERFGLPTHGG